MAKDFRASPEQWLAGYPSDHRGVLLTRTLVRATERLPLLQTATDEQTVLLYLRATSLLWSALANGTTIGLNEPIRTMQSLTESRAIGGFLHRHLLVAAEHSLLAMRGGFSDVAEINIAIEHLVGTDIPHRSQVLADANLLSEMRSPRDFLQKPMTLAPAPNDRRVPEMIENLREKENGWPVWADWIEARWRGARDTANVTRAYILVPPQLWATAGTANRWIERELAKLPIPLDEEQASFVPDPDQVESQQSEGVNFDVDSTGRIRVDPYAAQQEVQVGELQRELHAEIRSMALETQQRCTNSNLLAPLAITLSKFTDALGLSPAEMSPAIAILRGNALRIDLGTDEQRRASMDADDPPLPEGIAGSLQKIVQAWNIYLGTDAFLDGMDSNRLGPDSREVSATALKEVNAAINAAERDDIATADAIEVLRTMEALSINHSKAAERALAFQIVALRNFARAALKLALVTYRAGKVLGTTAGGVTASYGAILWTHNHAPLVRALLHDSPNALGILEWILHATAKIAY